MKRIEIAVTLDDLGRVTVPKIFRDALGLKTGEPIKCSINEQGHIEYYQEDKEKGENEQ